MAGHAFTRWAEMAAEALRLRALVARVVARCGHYRTAAAFDGWRLAVSGRRWRGGGGEGYIFTA